MTNQENSNQREHFRIKYPISERPTFKDIGSLNTYTILDLSESGMRLISPEHCLLGPQSKLQGEISFSDNSSANVSGKVIRITERYIIIKFIMGIEYPQIIEQQRYLLKKYRHLE